VAGPDPYAQNIGGSDSIKRWLKEGKRNMSFISYSSFVELYSRLRSFKQTRAPEKYCTFSMLRRLLTLFVVLAVLPQSVSAQSQSLSEQVQRLEQVVVSLESRITALEEQNRQLRSDSARSDGTAQEDTARLVSAVTALRRSAPPEPQETATTSPTAANPVTTPLPGVLPGGATLNYYLDGYYEYNFNNPVGRVNDLRAYDVLSNTFSLNQADFIFALDPDLSLHRRYGFRIDLQFGQATETLQGNPANEPRPDIYRNVFQAYGSYLVPVGHAFEVDMGKWASSLGIEGNYTKDQMNYTRSWYYYFLPFYHQGLRANYKLNDKVAFNYWIVNGTDQSEPTNAYKDELFGLVLQPAKTVSWTVNYYNGQEHPNTIPSSNCTIPVQPGLCEAPINPAPNGKLHIFDTYATWTATPKLTLAGEGDYVIEREWANAAPGESSAPQHVIGGAAYAQYQLTPRGALAARTEYLSDRGGLFSNATQALKEVTATYKFNVADGLDAFLEYRHDWTNILYFTTNNPASPANHQDTATVGLIWWYGGKQGAW
jgi:cell division protein FtsB